MSIEFSECTGMEVEIGSTSDELGESLGEGAEGAVYELKQRDDRAVKIFKEDKRGNKREKIETMVQDSMISPEDQTEIPWTTWPIEVVSRPSDGAILGYVMPYLDTDQHIDAQRYASQNLRWENTSQHQRYKPAINLVLTVYWLHQNGYAIGDLSEQNIRVNDGNVTLIDCDSYSIEESDFAGQMEAPRYTPPEGRGTTHEEIKQTDQFGVAVHIFQFLMAGFHPYQAVGEGAVDGPLPEAIQQGSFPYGRLRSRNIGPPPRAPDFSQLPKPVRRGFEQCFSKGQNNPSARPSLEKWLAILSNEGDFDVGGVDLSDVTIEDEKRERLDRNWQQEIRQGSGRKQTTSTADPSPTRTDTTTATSPTDDAHWADDLRVGQTAPPSDEPDQQPAGQNSSGQRSAGKRSDETPDFLPWAAIILLLLLFLFIIGMLL